MKVKVNGIEIKLSKISALHYAKLVGRSLLFIAALVLYIYNRVNKTGLIFGGVEKLPLVLVVIWVIYFIEMLLRFFPSNIESKGCQKQFKKNFMPTDEKVPINTSNKRVLKVFIAWVLLNLMFGALYMYNVIDAGIMILLSLAYSICDMICILFFCPFQTWFLKNKCCGTCRIYNWDFAMMFTPLLFVGGWWCWSLLILALGLFIEWEIIFYLHPERFAENTNAFIKCKNCPEHLCQHKEQLEKFIEENRLRFEIIQ